MSELKALESAYILGLVDEEIATENLVFTKADIAYKLDEWGKSKDMNILWVTGFSGSGKTTIANKLKEKYPNAQVIHLDDFYCAWNKEDLTKTLPTLYPKLYPRMKDVIQRLQDDRNKSITEKIAALNICIERIIALSKEDYGKTSYIVEGIQVYGSIRYDLIKDQPLVIKGTSAIGALVRRFKRGGYGHSVVSQGVGHTLYTLLDHLSWYLRDDKLINELRKAVKAEAKEISV